LGERRRRLVVDTSVAVKFYLPEKGSESAEVLLEASGAGALDLIAPSTILAEGHNAIYRQARRGDITPEDAHAAWADLFHAPVYTYAPEDLIERADALYHESGALIYDALFLALAEETDTVMVTDDGRLLRTIEGTAHASLACSLDAVRELL
jgi:predicted nucleic acid-binding protein